MLIVDLTYTGSLKQIDEVLMAHRSFLQKYYDLEILLASGPKNPREGGIIIALCEKTEMEKIIQEDPFYQNKLASYKITEFNPVKYCEALNALINKQINK